MDDLLNYLEESDLLLNKEGVEMKREVTDAFLFYRNFMLAFSIALVLFVIFLAVHFVMSNIKKPMALINDGIESISEGDLNTTINLNRNDEWATIESALNRMVSELKSLYDRIERSRDSLEKDVKERTRDLEITNEDLELAKEASEAANQAKSMFLSNMSHELRTPLNAILGFSQMMGRDLTIGEDQRERISIINRSGKHLLSLINDVLDIAKIESGRETLDTKSFELSVLLSEISELFYSRITDKGLFFTVEKNDDLPRYIKSDEGKLRQVLINLLGNALKFTETGGVTLRVRSGALAENIQTLHIEVEDTGVGIDSDQLENIFDPFIQAGHVQTGIKGTGLGLAISKSFVELLGGEISVESKPGEGSLFRVDLAVALAESAEVSGIEVVRPAVIGLEPGQSAWRILVVEDDAENRLLLNSLLLQVGFDTRQAENGEEAVFLFKQWQPHFIWMDMRMPVMDGYAATKKIRELPGGKEVKIVAVTAHAFTENDEEILATGCDGLVRKPYLEHEIFDTMAQHLGVEYLLGETAEAPAPEETMPITAEMLSELPAEILEELRQAALTLNREAISATLKRIEPQSPNIASGLRSLLGSFQIGRIRDLLGAVQ
jgi:signal transduction histidine kinase/CheY-like chemotaxis protein